MLQRGFGLDCDCFGDALPGRVGRSVPRITRNGISRFALLGTGRIASVKRLEYLLDVAREAAGRDFPGGWKADADDHNVFRLISKMKALPQVAYIGALPTFYAKLYDKARFMWYVRIRGLPNTFIEA